jgi:hypothetical protein
MRDWLMNLRTTISSNWRPRLKEPAARSWLSVRAKDASRFNNALMLRPSMVALLMAIGCSRSHPPGFVAWPGDFVGHWTMRNEWLDVAPTGMVSWNGPRDDDFFQCSGPGSLEGRTLIVDSCVTPAGGRYRLALVVIDPPHPLAGRWGLTLQSANERIDFQR